MSGFFDSLYNGVAGAYDSAKKVVGDACDKVKEVATDACNKVKEAVGTTIDKAKEAIGNVVEKAKEMAGNAYDIAEKHVSSVGNAVRLVVNTVKHPCIAIARASMEGIGNVIKTSKNAVTNLVEEAADWAKPFAKAGKCLGYLSWPLKILSVGEAAHAIYTEGKWKKLCEVVCSSACGAGAVFAVTCIVGATPVGWAALGVCAIGGAAAWAGDYLGGKIGDRFDGTPPPAEQPQPSIPAVATPAPVQQPQQSVQPQQAPSQPAPPQPQQAPSQPAPPKEEIRPATPAVPLEIRPAIPAKPIEIRRAIYGASLPAMQETGSLSTTEAQLQLASISPVDLKSFQGVKTAVALSA
jgi:hypothetical protein